MRRFINMMNFFGLFVVVCEGTAKLAEFNKIKKKKLIKN
jgi:hypothetical protein